VKPKASSGTKSATDNGCATAIAIGLGLLVLLAIGKCSSSDNAGNASSSRREVEQNLTAAVAAQSPPPVQRLDHASVALGIKHLRLAERAEGLSGAMIYSQNCYDALGRHFTWARLDICGAADLLAVRSLPETDTAGLENELTYFDSETAAGRYLAAATGAGEGAGEADKRLGQLQGKIASSAPVVRARPSVQADNSQVTGNTEAHSADEDAADAGASDPNLSDD
jgi:hypothetical protein